MEMSYGNMHVCVSDSWWVNCQFAKIINCEIIRNIDDVTVEVSLKNKNKHLNDRI